MPSIGVMQVVLSLGPGGTERLVIDLVKRLRTRFRMSVCCLDERGAWAPQVESLGVPVVACARRSGFHPSLSANIVALARRENVDVLHCHHYTPFVYGALAAYREPKPAVLFTEHGRLSAAGPSLKRRAANRLLARVPEAVYAVSDDLARHVTAEGFSTVQVVHNGIDPGVAANEEARAHARHLLGLGAGDYVMATVARLDPVKGFGTLLRAFARTREVVSNGRLLMIGDGPERAALEALAASLEIRDRVVITGMRSDARDLLAAADLYINSSITEGISLTILEAMAAGLPVIATRVGGTPEIFGSAGDCGVLVNAGDEREMAEAIVQLAADTPRRLRIGVAARERVRSHFTLDRMIATYAEAYERAGER